jgi:hypothetical protein
MEEPPVAAGAVNVTDACALPAVAVPIVGAPGNVGKLAPCKNRLTFLIVQRPLAFVCDGNWAIFNSKQSYRHYLLLQTLLHRYRKNHGLHHPNYRELSRYRQ